MFWFSGREAREILVPQPGMELTSPVLEGKVLTTGPPGKTPGGSYNLFILDFLFSKMSMTMSCGVLVRIKHHTYPPPGTQRNNMNCSCYHSKLGWHDARTYAPYSSH